MLEYKITDTTWRETYASREGAYFNRRGVSLMWRSRTKWWLRLQNEALLCTSQWNAPLPSPPAPSWQGHSGEFTEIWLFCRYQGLSWDLHTTDLPTSKRIKKARFWTYCWEKLWEMGKKLWDVTNFQAEGLAVGIMGIQWWIQKRGTGSPPLPYF